jgi:hypothetical protein
MIKASELRIGNVIWDDTRNKVKHVTHRVISDLASSAEPLPYSPIQLTPEWLERCRFVWDEIPDIDGGCNHNIYIAQWGDFEATMSDNDIFELEGFVMPHIKYVHQLQNLYFALSDNELEIKP